MNFMFLYTRPNTRRNIISKGEGVPGTNNMGKDPINSAPAEGHPPKVVLHNQEHGEPEILRT